MQSGAATRDVEIPVLEDITDKEVEGMSASKSEKATPKQSKLISLILYYLFIIIFFLFPHSLLK